MDDSLSPEIGQHDVMQTYREVERTWRERLLDEYQHAQVIDRMDRQRLLDEYQRTQAIDRMDQQNSTMSELARTLAGIDSSVGVMEADLARLATVAGSALPAIVEHVALSAKLLGGIEQILASPNEAAAAERVRTGAYALASAAELAAAGSPELADDWLEQAVDDLSRAVEMHQYHPHPWQLLAMASKQRGDNESAVRAYSRCALYAVTKDPALASWALLMAAGTLRADLDRPDDAAGLLRKYSKQLSRCAEIHLALAVHHGDAEAMPRALELAPVLAADARIAGVASVEQDAADLCRREDGPVARLRHLEEQVYALAAAAETGGLTGIGAPIPPLALPELGVDALLRAEIHIPSAVVTARRLINDINDAIRRLSDAAENAQNAQNIASQNLAQQAGKTSNERARRNAAFEQANVRRDEEYHHARRNFDNRVKEARDAVARTQQAITAAWRAFWGADAKLRRQSNSADFWTLVAPVPWVEHASSYDLETYNPLFDQRVMNLWRAFTGGPTVEEAANAQAQVLALQKGAAHLLTRAVEMENKAQARAQHPRKEPEWLRAARDAEQARHAVERARWLFRELLTEQATAQLEATKYRDPAWWRKVNPEFTALAPDNRKLDPRLDLRELTASQQEVLSRDEQRLAERRTQLEQMVVQCQAEVELRVGLAEQAARSANQLIGEASAGARHDVEQQHAQVKAAAEEEHQRIEAAAHEAGERAHREAEKARRLAELGAREAVDAVRAAREAVTGSARSVEVAIGMATASRGRLVPSPGSSRGPGL